MKKIILLILGLSYFLSTNGQKITTDQLLKRYKYSASEAFKTHNYGLALDYGLKADSLQPKQADMIFIIGSSYLYSHTKIKALPHLLFAKSKNYNPKEIDFYLAQGYHYNNQFDSATKYFKEQLRKLDTTSNASFADIEMYNEIQQKISQCAFGKQMVHDSLHVDIQNIGTKVNTKFAEYMPVVTADEKLMYFTSRRATANNKRLDIDTKPFENIFSSVYENGEWQTPVELGAPINSSDHDACIGISPDGQKIFVYKSKSARVTMGNIITSTLDGTQWKKPKKLGSNINSVSGWESSACLSPDGKRLFFSSDRDGGIGGHDIYYCDLTTEGEWGTPVNMGEPINTKDNEDAPFMHFDGRALFFSSDGHKTIGGYDIFTSTYMEDSAKWSRPMNLGYPVNTADDDVYFVYSADGSKGYFSSHRKDSHGEKDIYVVKRPNTDPNMIVMAGHILDADTKKPIYATITITDLNTKKVIGVFNSNKISGKYVLALNFSVNHSVEIEADGYVFNSENVHVSRNIFKLQHNQDFFLSKVKAGAKVTLNNIFFDFNKAELLPQSTTELDNIYEMLIANPNWTVEISGHTDSVGTNDYNLKLSKSRALTVVNYLIEKGINPKHLIAIGSGENKPVSDNGTEDGRKLNRRTDFTIKDIVVDHTIHGGHGGKYEKLNLDNVLEKSSTGIPTGYKLIMKVHFIMNDGDILTEYSHQQLNKVYDILKSDPKYKIKLIPSVDIVGNEYNNKGLYDQRAKTVSTYLMEKGLTRDRILVEEFVPNTAEKITDVAKADIKKRRVEFLLAE